jgi:hypothetical protein
MFDPNSITPSKELMGDWYCSGPDFSIHHDRFYKDYIVAARWGAAQAVEALRYQWPELITDRPPTEEDADECGFVQYLFVGRWNCESWENVAKNQHQAWLHTPRWRPKPEPTPKQKARALLDAVNIDSGRYRFTPEQVELLRQVVESAPEATP